MKTVLIPLGRKKEFSAIIDAHHLPLIQRYSWSLHEVKLPNTVKRYARCWNGGRPIYMHRLLEGLPAYGIVDHKNGNGLDNTDENRRLTTYSMNNMNAQRGYGGVYRVGWKWRAMVKSKGKTKCLGLFPDRESAMEARKEVETVLLQIYERELLYEKINCIPKVRSTNRENDRTDHQVQRAGV